MDHETTTMSGTHQTQLLDERRREEEEGQLPRSIHHVHFVDATAFVVC